MAICICPQWPIYQLDPAHYVFYTLRYEGGCAGNTCVSPHVVSWVGSTSVPWPQTCPDCGQGGALAADAALEAALPSIKKWDFAFPNDHDNGPWAHCMHLMNTDFFSFWFNRIKYTVKGFAVRLCPKQLDPSLGPDRIMAVAFEVENHPVAKPSFDVPEKFVVKLSDNAFRVNVCALDYIVFTAVRQ